MLRRVVSLSCTPLLASADVAKRSLNLHPSYNGRSSGFHEHAPRDNEDFLYEGEHQVLPGAHPLPLYKADNLITRPVVSPYAPSPQRVHPYFTEPIAELPHFDASVPIVYTYGTIKESIIVPVYNTADGTVSHTRELDPYVFGRYPNTEILHRNTTYWQVRCQLFSSAWDFQTREIWRKSKKNWPTTGMGLPRVSDRKNSQYEWGARKKPMKPWNMLMPTMPVNTWHLSNRMMLTLKMLQGKLQVVDRLTLEDPTQEAFLDLCKRMEWDVRHKGAGVLFMDGGSRLTPSLEFDRGFFYGSFYNGRCKVVRPTILCDEPYDYNKYKADLDFSGPKGQKNPIPINRFNAFDALEHSILVVTEGAVQQLEQEMLSHKLKMIPPHIRQQLPDVGALSATVLGDGPAPLLPIELEAAARTEESEAHMYETYLDNPYKPWADEQEASYIVDATMGKIERRVGGEKASWSMLD
jgi:ribosomal protein L4